jgi:hypothetical protein
MDDVAGIHRMIDNNGSRPGACRSLDQAVKI